MAGAWQKLIMAQCNHAEIAQNGPVPKRASPTDRFSLLPKELRDIVYSLVFQSDGGPWTLHIKPNPPQPFKHPGWSRPDPDSILSILALPRDRKYKACRREEPDEAWPDHLEEAFFGALDWEYSHRAAEDEMFQSYNEIISVIIYELTGIRRCRKKVSSHIQTLKDYVNKFRTESERILPTLSSSVSTLRILDASKNIQEITKTITHIQSLLPKLQSAFQEEHEKAILIASRPTLLDFSSSPTITIHAEVFRTLSAIISDPHSCISLYLHPPKPTHSLSLTLVNHCHRTHALSVLAATLVFDFGDNIKAIYGPQNPSLSLYIKRLNLLFVEGYMQIPLIEPLADCRSAHRILPNLRDISIEIWPRKPTRRDRDDMSWGEQTLVLLKPLGKLRGGAVRVVVGFRFESDCRIFEEGYVGWRRRRSTEVDGGEREEGSMCRRFYELERN